MGPAITTVSQLEVSDVPGLITDVNVELSIDHTFDGDLEVFLISEAGTRVELFTNVGSAQNNFTNTVLDDEADFPITSGSAPFTNSFRPEGSLAVYDGDDPNGTWTLEITDTTLHIGPFVVDEGALTEWQLIFSTGPHLFATVEPDFTGTARITVTAQDGPSGAGDFRGRTDQIGKSASSSRTVFVKLF